MFSKTARCLLAVSAATLGATLLTAAAAEAAPVSAHAKPQPAAAPLTKANSKQQSAQAWCYWRYVCFYTDDQGEDTCGKNPDNRYRDLPGRCEGEVQSWGNTGQNDVCLGYWRGNRKVTISRLSPGEIEELSSWEQDRAEFTRPC